MQKKAIELQFNGFRSQGYFIRSQTMNQPITMLCPIKDREILSNLSKASARVSRNKSQNLKRDLGLVSILTSQTQGETVEIELPSQEYLRLKRLQKTVRVTAEVVQAKIRQFNQRMKPAMVTLTYRPDVDWSPKHVSQYIDCVKKWAKRRHLAVHYIWVMELTKKGVPHYHVMWWIPKGYTMPKADKQGWWKHGMTNSVWARKPVGYLCKYTSKGIDPNSYGKIPRNARLHGSGGLTPPMRVMKIWECAPSWVREIFDVNNGVRKFGCYWVDRVTNKGFSSPWHFDHLTRMLKWKGFDSVVDITELDKFVKPKYTRKMPIPVAMYYHYSDKQFDLASMFNRLSPEPLPKFDLQNFLGYSSAFGETDDFAVFDYFMDVCSELND